LTLQNAQQLLLRGHNAAGNDWLLLDGCHDHRKLHCRVSFSAL